MERGDDQEPGLAVGSAHRVAGQGPGCGQQDGGAQEQRAADAGRRCPPKSDGGEQDGKPGRDADDAGDPDRRADQGGDWPARVVGQRRRQHGEHAGLREDGGECAGEREREGPIEGAGRPSLRVAVAAQHDEREDGTAERDGLANEPGGAQPQQHERDQCTPR